MDLMRWFDSDRFGSGGRLRCCNRLQSWALMLALATLLASCGGGGGDGSGPSSPPPPAPLTLPDRAPGSTTLFRVQSAAGDTTGGGINRTYTLADSGIEVAAAGATVHVRVRGDEYWEGWIRTSPVDSEVREGMHAGLHHNMLGSYDRVGFDWKLESNRCTNAEGILSVDRVRYSDGRLTELDLRLAQRCHGATGDLHVQVRWVADEQPVRAGPAPVPASLWRPAAGAVPMMGNIVHIETTGMEPVFEGRPATFTEEDAVLEVNAAGRWINIAVRSRDLWFARVRGIVRPEGLEAGYYHGLRGVDYRYNPARGAMEWYRGTGSCQDPRSWLAIDRIEYERGALLALEFRFEQRCGDHPGIVRGLVRWRADDYRLPPRPGPAPADLWTPPPSSLPQQGSLLYLESNNTAWVGDGGARLLTPANADFKVYDDAGTLRIKLDEWVSGDQLVGIFRGRYTVRQVEAGYRGILEGPGPNPAIGEVDFSGNNLGCSPGTRWYMVDEVAHRHGVLRSVVLRFELRCPVGNTVLRGLLRWHNDEPTIAAGPADPPPGEPALPPVPTMPPSESALLLESRGGEFVGSGRSWLYTAANALLHVGRASAGPSFVFAIDGDEDWSGAIWPPEGQSRLAPGRFEFGSRLPGIPTTGYAFSLGGRARGCNTNLGWFEIDRVEYDGDQVSLLEMRFEQLCDDEPFPLLGHLRLRAGEEASTVQPRPISAGLWSPPPGALPSNGSYVYLQPNIGGFIGAGDTVLLEPAADRVFHFRYPNQIDYFQFDRDLGGYVSIALQPPLGRGELLPGYYEATATPEVGSPLRMRASLSADFRGCSESKGWLAIDDIAYDDLGLVRIALRMMQFCDGMGPPAFAAMRWER